MDVQVIERAKEPENKRTRVVVYARVSTNHEEQENSLENQITHYEEVIGKDERYELVKIYHDFGLSGFKEDRPGFQEMMKDAREKQFDLIITKSITRFARNTGTILKATRELKGYGIGVFFELQNINTLTQAGELLLTIYAAVGQGESEESSVMARMAYQRKFTSGTPVQYLERSFGYQKTAAGEYVPDENACWVKQIFTLAASGYSLSEISRYMNKQEVPTAGGAKWTESTVKRIIEDVRYKGDFIMQRFYITPDRRELVNRGEHSRYYIKDDHEPLVDRALWEKANAARKKRREDIDTKDEVMPITNENYPYKKRLFCAKCGKPLYPRIYAKEHRLAWCCSGTKRFHKAYCTGVNFPDRIARSWNPSENIYVWEEQDELGKKSFRYKNEKTYLAQHRRRKKKNPSLPALTKSNYPFKDHVYCKYCGYHLTRVAKGTKIFWTCSGSKHHGIAFCKGVGNVPDEVLQTLGKINHDVFIGKEIIDGEERYGYSEEPDQRKGSKGEE